jgi:hypothetical protein
MTIRQISAGPGLPAGLVQPRQRHSGPRRAAGHEPPNRPNDWNSHPSPPPNGLPPTCGRGVIGRWPLSDIDACRAGRRAVDRKRCDPVPDTTAQPGTDMD